MNPRLSIWYATDPMQEKYPYVSTYCYCLGTPTVLIELNGEDPIYSKNFWGKIKMIGDDGNNNGKSYLVKGVVARQVKKSTKNGSYYTGDLTENKNVMHIPTGEKLDAVIQSVEDTKLSRKENGGHSYIGGSEVIRWDEGSDPIYYSMKDNDGNDLSVAKASMVMFFIDGKNEMPDDASNVEFWWHTHPDIVMNGVQMGYSSPSKADYKAQSQMKERNYKGNTFVIGTHNNKVTFYDDKKSLITVKYKDFLRMGRHEQ